MPAERPTRFETAPQAFAIQVLLPAASDAMHQLEKVVTNNTSAKFACSLCIKPSIPQEAYNYTRHGSSRQNAHCKSTAHQLTGSPLSPAIAAYDASTDAPKTL